MLCFLEFNYLLLTLYRHFCSAKISVVVTFDNKFFFLKKSEYHGLLRTLTLVLVMIHPKLYLLGSSERITLFYNQTIHFAFICLLIEYFWSRSVFQHTISRIIYGHKSRISIIAIMTDALKHSRCFLYLTRYTVLNLEVCLAHLTKETRFC